MSTDADKEYLRKHNIPTLFNDITQELFKQRPENPIPFLIEVLKKRKAERDAGIANGGAANGDSQNGSDGSS